MMKVEVIYLWKGLEKWQADDLKKILDLSKVKEHTARYELSPVIYKAEDIGPGLKAELDKILKTYYGIRSIKFYLEPIVKPTKNKLRPKQLRGICLNWPGEE